VRSYHRSRLRILFRPGSQCKKATLFVKLATSARHFHFERRIPEDASVKDLLKLRNAFPTAPTVPIHTLSPDRSENCLAIRIQRTSVDSERLAFVSATAGLAQLEQMQTLALLMSRRLIVRALLIIGPLLPSQLPSIARNRY
jgi:hypothetical protein